MLIAPDEIWLTQIENGHWRIEFKGYKFNVHEMENHYEVEISSEHEGVWYSDLCLTFTEIFENLKKHFN